MSVNIKFLLRVKVDSNLNSTCLLRFWLLKLFQIPTECNSEDQIYFHEFFTKRVNILDCKIKVPRKLLWDGHPYYYPILKSFEKCLEQLPKSLENILSMPIWYNNILGTKFESKVSKAGYNYLRDLYVDGQPITQRHLENHALSPLVHLSLVSIINKIPPFVKNILSRNESKTTVILPFQSICYKEDDWLLMHMKSTAFYNVLIYKQVKLPRGLLHWCSELELSDCQIKTALTFAHKCCTNIFDRVFQYKIVTQILPTNEYLMRYKVKDTNTCERCSIECDTIVHRLYECEHLVVIISTIFNFLNTECEQPEISLIDYLFVKQGDENLALNQILLELKKIIFYATMEDLGSPFFCEQFYCRLRTLIRKEKYVWGGNGKLDNFISKWVKFTSIYDFRGPDIQNI